MNSRNQSLDVLRGVAVLLVIGTHMQYYVIWKRIGWIGVDLFFVLSGFLISGLLFREYISTGTIDVGRFILRRGLKIWPAFYVFMAVMSLLVIQGRLNWRPFLLELVFLQNYFPLGGPVPTYHTWSLAVEEHFYLLLPMLLIVLLRRKRPEPFNAIPWIFLILMAFCLALRVHAGLPSGEVFSETHLRIDALFCGVTLSYLFHFRSALFAHLNRTLWLPLAALCITPAFILRERTVFMQSIGLTLLTIGFSLLLAWSISRIPVRRSGVLAYVGRHSYSIYLWHLPIVMVLCGDSFLSFWAAVALCIIIGIAMSKLIEIPVLKWRDRILPDSMRLASSGHVARTMIVGKDVSCARIDLHDSVGSLVS